MSRCLYNSSFEKFNNTDSNSLLGILCDNYHGEALTTTREAWKGEISIMKEVLSEFTARRKILCKRFSTKSRVSRYQCA